MEEEKRDNFSRDRSDNARKSPSGETGTHPAACMVCVWGGRFVTLSACGKCSPVGFPPFAWLTLLVLLRCHLPWGHS